MVGSNSALLRNKTPSSPKGKWPLALIGRKVSAAPLGSFDMATMPRAPAHCALMLRMQRSRPALAQAARRLACECLRCLSAVRNPCLPYPPRSLLEEMMHKQAYALFMKLLGLVDHIRDKDRCKGIANSGAKHAMRVGTATK